MLPGIDGLEVMRRVRAHDRDRTAIILLTARGEESDRIVGLRLGADDYVVKPFSPAELVARVDAVLRRLDTSPGVEPPLRVRRARDRLDRPPRHRRRGGGGAHPARVRAAAVPRPPPRPGVHAQPAHGPRLALLVLHGHVDRHRPHSPPAREDRTRSGACRATSTRSGASATGSRRDARPRLRRPGGGGRRRSRRRRLRLGRGLTSAADPRPAGLRHGARGARDRRGAVAHRRAAPPVRAARRRRRGAAGDRRRRLRRAHVRLGPRRVLHRARGGLHRRARAVGRAVARPPRARRRRCRAHDARGRRAGPARRADEPRRAGRARAAGRRRRRDGLDAWLRRSARGAG